VRQTVEGICPWSGYAAFTLELIIVLVVGAVLLQRRDP